MGAKISRAANRRRNHAAAGQDGHLSGPQASNHITSQQQRPTPRPASAADSPPTNPANAPTSPHTEHPPLSSLQSQQDTAMDLNATRDDESEAAATNTPLPPPPPPLPAAAVLPPAPLGQPVAPAQPQPMPPALKPEPRCLICTEELSADKPVGSGIRPCRLCHNDYCKSCVKDMFIKACKNTSRMPPKCCNILQLHVALPMLSPDEAKEYREKYEEWSTPNPMYCPIPTCSAFISNRLLPVTAPETKIKGKERVDSVIGTPKETHVSCPKCANEACTKCRQPAHAGAPCQPLDFGVDEETAAALKRWGYKRCPKCGNGVRRMMGCNHMQCLCGAQWCWWCLVPMDECGGNCYDQDQDDDDMNADEVEELERERTSKAALEGADAASLVPLVVAGTANGRTMNLDMASNDYWNARGANFGTEPAEEPPDRAWQCEHELETAKIDFEQHLKNTYPVAGMECSRCWSTVYPEIALPKKMGNAGSVRMAGGFSRPDESRLRGRDRGSRRGRTPGRAHTPLGIGHQTSGLHWHLDLALGDQAAEDASAPGNSPAPPQVIVDEYGDVIMADGDSYTAQRSMSIPGDSGSANLYPPVTANSPSAPLSTSAPQKTNAFPTEFTFRSEIKYPPFSFAYECRYCGILLCNSCKDAVGQETQAKLDAEAAAAAAAVAADEELLRRLDTRSEPTTSNTEAANYANASNMEPRGEVNGAQPQPSTSQPEMIPSLLAPRDPTPEQTEHQRRASEPSVPVPSILPPTTSLDHL